jgi:hypothetical protein
LHAIEDTDGSLYLRAFCSRNCAGVFSRALALVRAAALLDA